MAFCTLLTSTFVLPGTGTGALNNLRRKVSISLTSFKTWGGMLLISEMLDVSRFQMQSLWATKSKLRLRMRREWVKWRSEREREREEE